MLFSRKKTCLPTYPWAAKLQKSFKWKIMTICTTTLSTEHKDSVIYDWRSGTDKRYIEIYKGPYLLQNQSSGKSCQNAHYCTVGTKHFYKVSLKSIDEWRRSCADK